MQVFVDGYIRSPSSILLGHTQRCLLVYEVTFWSYVKFPISWFYHVLCITHDHQQILVDFDIINSLWEVEIRLIFLT